MKVTKENIQKILKDAEKKLDLHQQRHLLDFWDELDEGWKGHILSQIDRLDFTRIDAWIRKYVKCPGDGPSAPDIKAASFYKAEEQNQNPHRNYCQARQFGEDVISSGKVAAFTVAGGQGTRLAFDGPKGDFPISPVRNKTLFQLFAESIIAASQKYLACCPWYVMTSPLNFDHICRIFRSNDYFGLKETDVFIFQQGTLPNFGLDGKILMADKANISCSPDGHGGSLKALYQSGALTDMKKRGVEFISYFQVDNPLVNIFDPLFIGLHILDKAEMSSKAVLKNSPKEKVGVFCLIDEKVNVIEYSDLSKEKAELRNPDGSLVFGLGNIAIHIINVDFVEKINKQGFALPLHRAVKKIEHIDNKGRKIIPDKPNGIKLESFVFDALPLASNSIILQTLRQQEFAPVKNADGPDSPKTAKELMVARAVDWLESAGVKIPKKPDGGPDAVIEIAPAFALHKDDICAKLDKIPKIRPGDMVYLA